jgi:hypothetical protein
VVQLDWMLRRALSLALLVLLAVPLLGGFALASECVEPCPDDAEEESCPPVCTLCVGCAHAQTAIVLPPEVATPPNGGEPHLTVRPLARQSLRASDVFHVPLLG